jgi:hypothetical protein
VNWDFFVYRGKGMEERREDEDEADLFVGKSVLPMKIWS